MRREVMEELAKEISVSSFILVFFAQQKEFFEAKKLSPRPVTFSELNHYCQSEVNLRKALFRMQEEKILIKVGKGEWLKNPTPSA